jgi:tRNA A-37 threonylcarbamoyl transferase component Bud32
MLPISIRLSGATGGLLALPWLQPLRGWPEAGVTFREMPVGESRHVVRFVEADGVLYALKELPVRVARREYETLRELGRREFPSVRPLGLVERGPDEPAILVTDYLSGSFQFRRMFERLPPSARKHRERLLDAMAWLMVDLHRNGVFWGDCSLSNTLFRRDGQTLQAFLVDAETSEMHPSLSDGQRALDLEILAENVTGDLADIGAQIGRPEETDDDEAAGRVEQSYRTLWDELHREEAVGPEDRYRIEARVRRLNDLGFAVDELTFDPDAVAGENGQTGEHLRFRVAVAGRRFHATELRRLTGLDVGEGQATVLLNDLRAYRGQLEWREARSLSETEAAERWLSEILRPTLARLAALALPVTDLVQAYCDLLEVRWLLSEEAGRDVGDEVAIDALRRRRAPVDSAARMLGVEAPTAVYVVSEFERPGAAGDAGSAADDPVARGDGTGRPSPTGVPPEA